MSVIGGDSRVEAWRRFLTLHARIVDVIDAEIQAAGGLPLQLYDILIELFQAEERRLRLHVLAERVLLSRSSITRLVDQLETQGLLARAPDPDDRRGAYATLTPAGESAIRASWPHYREAIHRHFGAPLSDDEAKTLIALLGRINERLTP